jgi:hypothetical protein
VIHGPSKCYFRQSQRSGEAFLAETLVSIAVGRAIGDTACAIDADDQILSAAPRFEDLFDVLLAVFVRGLEVLQFLVQVADVGLDFLGLGRQTPLDFSRGTRDEPGNISA